MRQTHAVELSVVTQITERLAGLDALHIVESALDISALKRLKGSKTVVVVFPLADDFDPSVAGSVGAIQHVTGTVAVAHSVPATNDPAGTDVRTMEALKSALDATRGSLNGWKPEIYGKPARESIILRSGRLISIDGSSLLWTDSYVLTWHQTSIQD